MTAFLSIPSRGDRPRTAATVVETGRSGRPVWALVRRVAKAAAEIVELVEIQEGELDVAALAAGMANRDFGPEREGEFVSSASASASASTVAVALREGEGRKCRLGCAAARAARRAEADARRPKPTGLRAVHAVIDRAAPHKAGAPVRRARRRRFRSHGRGRRFRDRPRRSELAHARCRVRARHWPASRATSHMPHRLGCRRRFRQARRFQTMRMLKHEIQARGVGQYRRW